MKAGYWYESFNFPITNTYYGLQNGALVFNRTLFADPDGRGTIHSPYVRATTDLFKDFHVDAGVRYLNLQMPGETAQLSYSSAANPNLNYNSATYTEWLPYGGSELFTESRDKSLYAAMAATMPFPKAGLTCFRTTLPLKPLIPRRG